MGRRSGPVVDHALGAAGAPSRTALAFRAQQGDSRRVAIVRPHRRKRGRHATHSQRGFDAFISYSHLADERLASALRDSLQGFAKPWYRQRALRVFRDDANLHASPDLWAPIESALGDSRYMVLLASLEAAKSGGVAREVVWWLEHKSPATLLIVLAGGELHWRGADFAWERDTPLPVVVQAAFAREPKHVDLRWAREEQRIDRRDPRFLDNVAELAAVLLGRSKDELVGEDVRAHRRAMRFARGAIAALA